LTFFLSFLFLYFWSEAQNDYNDFDWWVTHCKHFFLSIWARLGVGISHLIIDNMKLYDIYLKSFCHVFYLFTHLCLCVVVVVVCSSVRQVAVLGLFLSVLFSLYLVPLGMYSPCIKEAGTLGPAPRLIGHRGAPMLAPENTVMSFEKALEAGGEGLETDVTISYDGVPFLMHDSTLRRTTNVAEVFPNRTDLDASMFTWAELQQLNAGSWFLSRDPFGTVSSLPEADCSRAQNQSIPSLAQFLEVASSSGRLVLFDLRRPPQGHPYSRSFINTTLQVVQAHINSSQVTDRELVRAMDPELQQTSGEKASIQELTDNHITRLNLHYSTMSQQQISKYQSVNISTNLFVISQPWLYTLAWCAGAQSVTTNSIHILSNIKQPLFLMTPEEYTLMWILTDAVSAFLIITVFIFHWCVYTHTHTHTHTHTALIIILPFLSLHLVLGWRSCAQQSHLAADEVLLIKCDQILYHVKRVKNMFLIYVRRDAADMRKR
uniref:Glycerophosphodiester phosphodiesterase domain containing 4a n=1 Tax=Labrus bergylta TaxID=56723 RepID=A0A3Q3EZX8_9LABR